MIDELRADFADNGLQAAVQYHDDGPIYDWLVQLVSFQGVADSVATTYLEQHGCVTSSQIERGFIRTPSCPKLGSYWQFEACGYRKGLQICNEPSRFSRCPLPKHDLRNGTLNRASYSLWLFMRDVAERDFVGWLDSQLLHADGGSGADRGGRLAQSVLSQVSAIHGVSFKVMSMALSSLLLAGDPGRERWVTAGANMIVIDTLVHNWLHRTGLLRRFRTEHMYGVRCYQSNGCADIVKQVAKRIDASEFNSGFPQHFPRYVQKVVWNFCAQSGLDRCNGNQIKDAARCKLTDCPLYQRCDRRALNPASTISV